MNVVNVCMQRVDMRMNGNNSRPTVIDSFDVKLSCVTITATSIEITLENVCYVILVEIGRG